ncbi:MAG: hypothetical protein JRF69_11845 [Deltaproteobacteria bacterium]|nr:hypothetical protein [Deltaproteobacteria bacterium]
MPNEQPERIMHPTQEEQPIHLLDYYHVVVKQKWLILASLVIVITLVLYHNASVTPIYQATTTLIIDRLHSRSPLTGQRYRQTTQPFSSYRSARGL